MWTTISKPIKNSSTGLSSYMIYLENPEHKNHKEKTNEIILTFGDSKIFRQSVVKNCAEVDYKNQLAKKGGRPMSSLAQSFVFSLPPGVPKPTPEQWNKITEVLVWHLCQKFNIPVKHAEKYIFANVHDQSNPHLNLVVCKARNGVVFEELQKKPIIGALKRAFSTSYELQTGYSPSTYKKKAKTPKKRLPKWQYEYLKKKEELKQKKEVLPLADTPSFSNKPKLG